MEQDPATEEPRGPIAQLGQPVLRRKADPVPPEVIGTPEFRQTVEYMLDVLEQSGGVGLAGECDGGGDCGGGACWGEHCGGVGCVFEVESEIVNS